MLIKEQFYIKILVENHSCVPLLPNWRLLVKKMPWERMDAELRQLRVKSVKCLYRKWEGLVIFVE